MDEYTIRIASKGTVTERGIVEHKTSGEEFIHCTHVCLVPDFSNPAAT